MQEIQSGMVAALVVAMLASIGLRLQPSDLLSIFRYKTATVFALAFNLIAFPFIVVQLGSGLQLSVAAITGLTLLAASPGGPTGPVFAAMGRGNLGYATGLMVTLSLISVFAAPLIVNSVLERNLPMNFTASLFKTLLIFQLIPLVVGMIWKRLHSPSASITEPWVTKAANVLLLAVIILLLIAKGEMLTVISLKTHLTMIGLVFLGLACGYLALPPKAIAMAISQVTAVRNISVALLMASSFFPEGEVTTSVLAFGFYTMTIPAFLALLARRIDTDASDEKVS